jgi:hypothetical protein
MLSVQCTRAFPPLSFAAVTKAAMGVEVRGQTLRRGIFGGDVKVAEITGECVGVFVG